MAILLPMKSSDCCRRKGIDFLCIGRRDGDCNDLMLIYKNTPSLEMKKRDGLTGFAAASYRLCTVPINWNRVWLTRLNHVGLAG